MSISRSSIARAVAPIALTAASAAFMPACSRATPSAPDGPRFSDVSSAPAAIQTAAKAVVRVHTAGQYGTGAFISSTGLLLTNNHVLGIPVCPREGCSIELTFGFERGQPVPTPMIVAAVPIAIDVGLDMAIVQISTFDVSGGAPLATPDFLTWRSAEVADLVGEHITIVGHPEADLKKWTDGVVFDDDGEWLMTSAYILPGDSGSPILDDNGALVGIVHRGPTSQDLFTDSGANEYSIGSPSAKLIAASTAPLPATVRSLAADTTAADVVANDLVYANGNATSVSVGGVQTPIESLLGAACDAALARTNFVSPDDLTAALVPCTDAMIWFECRSDATRAAFAEICPLDAVAWQQRFTAINAAWLAMNGTMALGPLTGGVASLSSSIAEGNSAATASLSTAIAAANPRLDPSLAYSLARYGIAAYSGVSVADYLRDYTSIPQYQDFASTIANAATWIVNQGLTVQDATNLISALASDPKVSVGSKLAIEVTQYSLGLVK